jgi:hypothetical protein
MVLVGTKKYKENEEKEDEERKKRNIKNNSEFSHRLGKVIRNFLFASDLHRMLLTQIESHLIPKHSSRVRK